MDRLDDDLNTPADNRGQRIAAATTVVDINLVLAFDCSSSMDFGDYKLQVDGAAAALRDPMILAAVNGGVHRQIGLSLVQWSHRNSQVIGLPWTLLAIASDFKSAATTIETMPRQAQPGGTGIAAGLAFCRDVLQSAPFIAARSVIDVSGDGDENEGGDVPAERNRTVAAGVTINGLPIISGSKHLESYYRENVIGGDGAFVLPTDTSLTYKTAIRKKLLREILQQIS